MNDAELRSLDRLCSKDDLSDGNVATLTVLGLKAGTEIRKLRAEVERLTFLCARTQEDDERTSAAGHERQRYICQTLHDATGLPGGGYATCETATKLRALLRESVNIGRAVLASEGYDFDECASWARLAAIRTEGDIE